VPNQFELGKYAGESGFERDDGLGIGLFAVDKVEDVAEGVNRARGVKILIEMRDHLEPLSVKLGFLDEEVGDGGLDIVVDNLLPPASGCARGTKDDARETIVEVLNNSNGTANAPPTPPMERERAMEAPPDTEPLFR